MKIAKNGITKHASLCRISLQVIESYSVEEDSIDIPDEWLIKLNDKFEEVSFSDEGKYYLTQTGWENNKESIKKAYEKTLKYHPYTTEENTWSAFETYVENHYKTINKIKIKKRQLK